MRVGERLNRSHIAECVLIENSLKNQLTWGADDFLGRLRAKRYVYIGAWNEQNVLIGYAGLRTVTSRRVAVKVLIENIAVHSDYQKKGVGRQLMLKMIE